MMKCLDCDMMICREYHVKNDVWKGYCMKINKKVMGDDDCHAESQKQI